MGIADVWESFLSDNPQGHLYVATGFASPAGLSWLHERTQGRAVTVVIGAAALDHKYWGRGDKSLKSSARAFLGRKEVSVKVWKREAGASSDLHSKLWVIRQRPRGDAPFTVAAVLGSANLTDNGLFHNQESMQPVRDEDLEQCWTEMDSYARGSRDAAGDLLDLMSRPFTPEDRRSGANSQTTDRGHAGDRLYAASSDSGAAVKLLERICADVGKPRAEQIDMARDVYDALTGSRPTIIQLGTGGGKSFAYLAGAIAAADALYPTDAASEDNRRIVISTCTNPLITQLADDLKKLHQHDRLNGKSWRTLKGVHQYACVAEAKHILKQKLAIGEKPAADKAAEAAAQRVMGMRFADAELSSLIDSDPEAEKIKRDSAACPASQCSSWDKCHGHAARQSALAADIVITNHALALRDAHLRENPLLGDYRFMVVDEAHALPEAAETYARKSVSPYTIRQLGKSIRKHIDEVSAIGFNRRVEDAASVLEAFIAEISRLPPEDDPDYSPSQRGTGYGRVKDDLRLCDQPDLAPFFELPEYLRKTIDALMGDQHYKLDDPNPEIEKLAARVKDLNMQVRTMTAAPPSGELKAMHVHTPGGTQKLLLADYDTAKICSRLLKPHRWAAASATVTSGLPGSIGFNGAEVRRLGFPMDYARRTRLVTFGCPKWDDEKKRMMPRNKVWDHLLQMMEAAGGRTLLLFPSRNSMKDAHSYMQPRTGLNLLLQPDNSSHVIPSMRRKFKNDPEVCLFGVKSFWEGLDVPGPSCSMVVIERLPNLNPDDISVKCREEADQPYDQQNREHVALMLMQGWGRLLRNSTDEGLIVLADKRSSPGLQEAKREMGLKLTIRHQLAPAYLRGMIGRLGRNTARAA